LKKKSYLDFLDCFAGDESMKGLVKALVNTSVLGNTGHTGSK
jgi:hypothetical protein